MYTTTRICFAKGSPSCRCPVTAVRSETRDELPVPRSVPWPTLRHHVPKKHSSALRCGDSSPVQWRRRLVCLHGEGTGWCDAVSKGKDNNDQKYLLLTAVSRPVLHRWKASIQSASSAMKNCSDARDERTTFRIPVQSVKILVSHGDNGDVDKDVEPDVSPSASSRELVQAQELVHGRSQRD